MGIIGAILGGIAGLVLGSAFFSATGILSTLIAPGIAEASILIWVMGGIGAWIGFKFAPV